MKFSVFAANGVLYGRVNMGVTKNITIHPAFLPNMTKTTSNNIFEVATTLGIEAARNAIIKEALSTMREQGVDTDIRHLLVVADAMTNDGTIKAIGRYGLAGKKSSVLSRANFEETVKHLTQAASAGEIDPLESVIENIIIGNIAPIGTGMIKLKVKD